MAKESNKDPVFERIKNSLLNIDPVAFAEKYLKLEGKPFRLTNNGYKPFVDIYRYIGIKALEKDSKGVVILKSRQVGGTTMAAVLEMFFMGSGHFGVNGKPPIRVVHAFPQLDLAFAYSKSKLNPMIQDSLVIEEPDKKTGKAKTYMQSLLDQSASANDSLQFKQFVGGNHLWIESVGLDGNRLRGKTADILLFDEIQDMGLDGVGNSLKILNKSPYGNQGVQVYFGTPKQKGSEFWKIWEKSSQQYYYLGCEKCEKHFPLYTPGNNDWENIWIYEYIVRCTHCGHEQDKHKAADRGKWVATRDVADCSLIGFHINQLYMPGFTREQMEAQKPGIHPANTERTYQNEVLGEFFQGEASILTPEEIREKGGDPERKFSSSIAKSDDTLVFLGVDIGAKQDLEQLVDSGKSKFQGQSYSTAVVVSVSSPYRLKIEYAMKFKRNDLESKKTYLEELMRRYSVNLAVMDIGFTNDFSEVMQTQYGDKFLSSQASGKINNKVKYNSEIFPKVINFERDFWIAEMFEQIKKGHVRFPLGNYEQVAWLMHHCCAFDIKPSISRYGDVNPHYVKSGANDGFMALLNAYIAYKFYLTDGFKNTNPLLQKEHNKQIEAPVLLGYIPKMK